MSTSASPSTSKDSDSIEAAVASVKQKRSAERQLTKDDDPDDDDQDTEGAGATPFRKADEQVLKSRRILRARRPVTNSVPTSDDTTTPETTIITATTATSSLPSNPFASTTLIVEPQLVQLPAPVTNTSTTTPAEPKVPATSETEQEQSKLPATTNEEQIKDKVDNLEVTHSAPETSTSGAVEATATNLTSTTTATTPGPFKVFGSFAGFGKGFTNSGFGTAATTLNATVPESATTASTSTGFAFASTSTSTFGTASSSTTSATAGSIFGSVSSNTFSFGFANQTNGETQTVSVSPKVTLPESVELTTGEEEELNLHDCRCKTFKWVPFVETEESTPAETKTTLSVKPSKDFQIQITDAGKDDGTPNDTNNQQASENKTGDEKQQQELTGRESPNFRWQELGVGPMKLLQDNSDPPKYRLVQRRESSPNGPATKVLLNLPLYKESKVSLKAGQENYLSFITIGHDGRNETYLWKFKEVSQAQIFARFLEGILPHARSCFVG